MCGKPRDPAVFKGTVNTNLQSRGATGEYDQKGKKNGKKYNLEKGFTRSYKM